MFKLILILINLHISYSVKFDMKTVELNKYYAYMAYKHLNLFIIVGTCVVI